MERVSSLVKELIAECHEKGFPVFTVVIDKTTGRSIRTADGTVDDVLQALSVALVSISKTTGENLDDIIDNVVENAEIMQRVVYGGDNEED